MKLTSLHISLGISVLCHVVGVGIYFLAAANRHEPATWPAPEKTIALTLIAAPEAPTKQPPIEPVVTAPVKPRAPEIIAPTKPAAEIPASVESPQPSVAGEAKPAPPAPPPGDGSSPHPGRDATTQKADVGVKATPNYLKNPEPPYPPAARRRHQEGVVLVSVRVTAQGRTEKVEIKQSSGYSLLDEAALNAVRDWEFVPARLGPIALASEIEVPVRFKLMD